METLLKTDLIHDKDPRVQLAAILYLSQNTASAEAGQALYGLSEEEAIKGILGWLKPFMLLQVNILIVFSVL